MPSMDYSDWRLDEDEDEVEIDYSSWENSSKDAILFAIHCSDSMLAVDPDRGEDPKSNFHAALECALELQKRKVIVGPNDSVGILFFNTLERKGDYRNIYVYRDVSLITASSIQDQMKLLAQAEKNPLSLRKKFTPAAESIPIGDVLMACNVLLRNGAAKTGSKRVFLITDDDDPTRGMSKETAAKMRITARTRAGDIYDRGWNILPFFISSPSKPFDPRRFWREALSRNESDEDVSVTDELTAGFDEIMKEMQIKEVPRRTGFHVPLHLADGITIDIKGYGLVTEQKKGQYIYLADREGQLAEATVKTTYMDKEDHGEVPKPDVRYALQFGKPYEEAAKPKQKEGDVDMDEDEDDAPTETRGKRGKIFNGDVEQVTRDKVLFTQERIKELKTLGLEPGIKILGFKDRSELMFVDNVKHSLFIYPSEDNYTGSTRTFAALLKSSLSKGKIAVVLAVTRRGTTPIFAALVPQAEEVDESGAQVAPPGFHMIPYPYADDIRESAYDQLTRSDSKEIKAARAWIDKMTMKTGYMPDNFPNPTLNLHYRQLQAAAFNEDFEIEEFDDLTVPNYQSIHKRAGKLIEEFKDIVDADTRSHGIVAVKTGAKRAAETTVDEAEVRSRYDSGQLGKLTVVQLRAFLMSRSVTPTGKLKAPLLQQVQEYLDSHS